VSETTDNRGPNMKHIQHQEEIRELEATCEGLDSYAAVCVANVQRLESRVRVLEDALKLTQFGFDNRYCPVCAGFNMSGNGSTEMVHTKDCMVGKALEVKL
jgi:hypothetical protein